MSRAWLRRKVPQGCPARRGGRASRAYFWIVDLATRMSSLQSSPRMRSAPQSGLAAASPGSARRHLWLPCNPRGARFTPPDLAEQLPVPAQERIGLDEHEGRPPGADTTGQEHQQRAVGRGAAGALHTPLEHHQLLPQQRVLGDQFPLAAGQIGDCAGDECGRGGFGGRQETVAESLQGEASGAGGAVQETSERGRLLGGMSVVRGGPREDVPRLHRV